MHGECPGGSHRPRKTQMRVRRGRSKVRDRLCRRSLNLAGAKRIQFDSSLHNGSLGQTSCKSEDLRTIFRTRRRRLPTARHASVEQFIRARLMTPDGDRRQSTESRGVINKPYAARMINDDVMRVFVLNDDIFDHLHGFLPQSPTNHVLQCLLRRYQ